MDVSADWNKIKTEYITTDTTYRKLAEKYGVSRVQIGNVGKEEKWVELRRQHLDRTVTKTLDKISQQQADRAAKIHSVADKLLLKIEAIADGNRPLASKDIRALTAAIKDLKEIQNVRSDADRREQEARISNLQKQADRAENDKTSVTISLEGGIDAYVQ